MSERGVGAGEGVHVTPNQPFTPYTSRVQVGSYYTDGNALWRVESVSALGLVILQNAEADLGEHLAQGMREVGIDAFRRKFWLVRHA